MISLHDIRQTFLDYFAKNGHRVLPSSSLVPEKDPTLLFTNAGMVPFKDYFTGKAPAPFPKVATSQKCVRAGGKHNDLENVGYTARHHTFFEMLGNFSFGDYFKETAISHAWHVVTKEFGLSPEKLYVTVFSEDEEAANLWKKMAGLPDSRILRIATTDNFWSMGETGPCGPCSEIFYDHGDSVKGGLPGTADADGDRYTEIWNLVFMQYEQKTGGARVPLPRPCIDTGIGLERLAAVLQGKQSNYDIDVFQELIETLRKEKGSVQTSSLCGGMNDAQTLTPSYHVLADHMRSASFLIADGVFPLNEGRGYVLRRIIRRAIRHARLLGVTEPVLYKIVEKLVALMGDAYPELIQHKDLIKSVLYDEENRFGVTLDLGLKWVEESLKDLTSNVLPGDVAFRLYDTYGFPLDLTEDILRGKGFSVDKIGFDALMQKQRNLSKRQEGLGLAVSAEGALTGQELAQLKIPETQKKCYDTLTSSQKILFLKKREGRLFVVLDGTPFYAESGGQAGDRGFLTKDSSRLLEESSKTEFGTRDSKRRSGMYSDVHEHSSIESTPPKTVFEEYSKKSSAWRVESTYPLTFQGQTWVVHEGATADFFQEGDSVEAAVDADLRKRTAAHHSAAHLLQAALREVLGKHVTQKGSSVNEKHIRFDFSHPKGLSPEERQAVEARVNAVILLASPTETLECDLQEARTLGALTFFEEKYGERVRVVRMREGDSYFSQEFCGGTHVANTGQIGLFKILSEEGVAAGVRRMEAVVGHALLEEFAKNISEKDAEIARLKEEQRKLQKQRLQAEAAHAQSAAQTATETCGSVRLTVQNFGELAPQQMRNLATHHAASLKEGVAVFISSHEGKIALVVCVGKADEARLSAKDLAQAACEKLGGQGGGKGAIAQGGGSNPAALGDALDALRDILKNS
ncbi:alanine--tRNA ligase [Alphaproteobacteria bacterium]|nr:alanine--tRNA ligase [Alphaproteobacteria bacterium]GHS97322.1 alanine--tRNA ligase [Alphaproteobacteria bacterium]